MLIACRLRTASGYAPPVAHGFAHAEDCIGYVVEYYILGRECPKSHLGGPELMSATGHKRTLRRVNLMSALLPKGTFASVRGRPTEWPAH